jgi:hypothetical protein
LDGGVLAIARRVLFSFVNFLMARPQSFAATFIPSYGVLLGGWPPLLIFAGRVFAWVCAFLWVLPFICSCTRALSLAACLGQLYLGFGMEYAFPWYFPPVTVLTICAFAFVVNESLNYAVDFNREDMTSSIISKVALDAVKVIAGAPVLVACIVSLVTAVQLRAFETIIDQGNLKQIGQWLNEHASTPRDTVFLEPLGFIGFYSNLKMYDYPGLSSDEMIEARKAFPPRDLGDRGIFAELIPYMKPDWIVLRPNEIAVIEKKNPMLLTRTYNAVHVFDVTHSIDVAGFLPGRPMFHFNQKFTVFHLGLGRTDKHSSLRVAPEIRG